MRTRAEDTITGLVLLRRTSCGCLWFRVPVTHKYGIDQMDGGGSVANEITVITHDVSASSERLMKPEVERFRRTMIKPHEPI